MANDICKIPGRRKMKRMNPFIWLANQCLCSFTHAFMLEMSIKETKSDV